MTARVEQIISTDQALPVWVIYEDAEEACSNCTGYGEVMQWLYGDMEKCSRCDGIGEVTVSREIARATSEADAERVRAAVNAYGPADPDPTRMTCGDCKRPFSQVMDFLVATSIWNYVMAGEEQTTYTIRPGLFNERLEPRCEGVGGVVCLACFDKRAKAAGVEYREHVLIFGVDCWMGGHYNDGMPLEAPEAPCPLCHHSIHDHAPDCDERSST